MLHTAQSNSQSFAEFTVKDSLEALNAAMSKAGIAASDVVTIIPVPRVTPAIGDHEPKLRVIYRAAGPR